MVLLEMLVDQYTQIKAVCLETGSSSSDWSLEKVKSSLGAASKEQERQIQELIAGTPELPKSYRILASVPGIDPIVAAAMIAWMNELGAIVSR